MRLRASPWRSVARLVQADALTESLATATRHMARAIECRSKSCATLGGSRSADELDYSASCGGGEPPSQSTNSGTAAAPAAAACLRSGDFAGTVSRGSQRGQVAQRSVVLRTRAKGSLSRRSRSESSAKGRASAMLLNSASRRFASRAGASQEGRCGRRIIGSFRREIVGTESRESRLLVISRAQSLRVRLHRRTANGI
jgi:hypothetical protein